MGKKKQFIGWACGKGNKVFFFFNFEFQWHVSHSIRLLFYFLTNSPKAFLNRAVSSVCSSVWFTKSPRRRTSTKSESCRRVPIIILLLKGWAAISPSCSPLAAILAGGARGRCWGEGPFPALVRSWGPGPGPKGRAGSVFHTPALGFPCPCDREASSTPHAACSAWGPLLQVHRNEGRREARLSPPPRGVTASAFFSPPNQRLVSPLLTVP